MSQFQNGGADKDKKTNVLGVVPASAPPFDSPESPSDRKSPVPRLIFVGENPLHLKKVEKFAKSSGFDFHHYSEAEWATLEEIDQYIQDEELSKKTVHLPAGKKTVASMDEIEAETIRKVLQKTNGNVLKASQALKIARATLYRKMERYGLNLKREREQQMKKYKEAVKSAA